MIVEFNFEKKFCKVTKEKGDKKFSASNWADAESTFLYHVLQILKDKGYDLIKKRMWKDGHLVDDSQQYIRSRSKGKNAFCIWNGKNAIYDAGKFFNGLAVGEVLELDVETNIFTY